MPDRRARVLLTFGGGWSTDFGPSFIGTPQGGVLSVPWLMTADNVIYELDGAPHKVGGSTRLNATAISSGTNTVHGFFDAWYQGTAGTETQIEWAYAGTALFSMAAMGGTWTSRATGLEDSLEPCFTMAGDIVVWSSTSNVDVPRSLTSGPAVATLGGSPPNFDFSVWHQNRLWAAGVSSNPSRLYYSELLAPENWTGAGSGSIDIDPEDGDRIVGLRSHKNELLVLKGPNRLSVHRITGSSPTGTAAFARIPFVVGVGGINHNSIITVGDDVVFVSPRGIHSLAATAAFGDYIEAFLNYPWLTYFQDNLNHTVLTGTWGVNYFTRGIGIWNFARSGGTTRNILACYDYRFRPGRWSTTGKDSAYVNAHSLAIMQTPRVHRCFAGLTTGYVQRIMDVVDRSTPGGTAYTATATWPFLNFGSSGMLKTAEAAFLSMAPKGNYTTTIGWTRDTDTEETTTVNQGGVADTLG